MRVAAGRRGRSVCTSVCVLCVCARARVSVCVCAFVSLCLRERAYVCVRACVRACVWIGILTAVTFAVNDGKEKRRVDDLQTHEHKRMRAQKNIHTQAHTVIN